MSNATEVIVIEPTAAAAEPRLPLSQPPSKQVLARFSVPDRETIHRLLTEPLEYVHHPVFERPGVGDVLYPENKRRPDATRFDFAPEKEENIGVTRFRSDKSYMDEYINPPKLLKAEVEEKKKHAEQSARSFPEQPEKHILLFLI